MDIIDLERKLGIDGMSADEQMKLVIALQKSVSQKASQERDQTIGKSAELVIQGLKKIKSDMEMRFSELNGQVQGRVASIKDGRDGKDGKDGRDGKQGPAGSPGPAGKDGIPGRDGVDGANGVGVSNAYVDFDGQLVIVLDNGREINAGDVVAPDLAERIKVITNGGGTSQYVLDTLASLQSQISAITGGLTYKGTWNASTNTPTLASSTGTTNWYYVVSVSGSTNLNGITDWVAGDWAIYNGTAWQKIDQTNLVTSVNGQTGAVSLTYTDVNAIGSVTSTDSSVTISTTTGVANLSVNTSPNVVVQVRNTTGATLTKGTVVYISGATGQIPTVTKAIATSDTTSAQTLGVISADLANNSNGNVTIIGLVTEIDTSAYTDGAQLYLSPTTAGGLTATKPYAPNHLVYVAIVEYAHAIHGKLFVKVQNGYELDELHNVYAQTPSNGHTIIWNATTQLWESNALTAGTGIGITNGAGSITVSNTGVTSVSGTSPVSSSGGATPAISLASGYGDTQNPYASKTANYVLAAPNGVAGAPSFRAIVAADIPTLNQNTTGTASNVTGTVAVANGGTNLTSFTANGLLYASSTSALATNSALTFNGSTLSTTGNAIISDNSANVALRITQIGAGNAFLVEDSASPDSSPFVIDANGRLILGNTASIIGASGVTSQHQQHGTTNNTTGKGLFNWATSVTGNSQLQFNKSKSGVIGTYGAVSSGDWLGSITFAGDDGTNFIPAASILVIVDGIPGTNDMPGRLVFSTTADGASSPTEKLRIANTGAFGLSGANYGTSGQVLTSGGASATPTWTTPVAASAPKLLTTNFTIEESGGKLLFKYGATTIASMDSTGVITSATNIVANGTP